MSKKRLTKNNIFTAECAKTAEIFNFDFCSVASACSVVNPTHLPPRSQRPQRFLSRFLFCVLGVLCGLSSLTVESAERKIETKNSANAAGSAVKRSLDPSRFSPNMSFGEAIDILRYSTNPPLNIVVLWRDLSEKAGIDRTTPIGMDGVTGIPLGKHLELLLMSVSAGSKSGAKLGYVVQKGVIIVATTESLPRKMQTRVYDITDLVAEPANYSWRGLMGPMGFYGGPFANMGYGGYGSPYGFGGPGSYAVPYGATPYGYGNYSGYPYGSGGYGYNRGASLGNLIGTLYGPSGARTYRNNRAGQKR